MRPSERTERTADRRRLPSHRTLVDEHLPQSFSGPTDTWQLLGTAMIARMADMVESVVVLLGADRDVDGAVLVRVLYEAVVKFCWISIDPDMNYLRWQEDTNYWEHRLRRDLLDYELERVTEEELAEYAAARQMPPMPDMAIAADKHWGGRIVGFQPYIVQPCSRSAATTPRSTAP